MRSYFTRRAANIKGAGLSETRSESKTQYDYYAKCRYMAKDVFYKCGEDYAGFCRIENKDGGVGIE
jgi:hypothetical protein